MERQTDIAKGNHGEMEGDIRKDSRRERQTDIAKGNNGEMEGDIRKDSQRERQTDIPKGNQGTERETYGKTVRGRDRET